MRSLIVVLAALAFATAAAADPPRCTKGVPCGNACIAKGKVCHVGAASASSAGVAAAATTGASAAPGKAPPTCTAGKTKLCGKACIPVAKTCSK